MNPSFSTSSHPLEAYEEQLIPIAKLESEPLTIRLTQNGKWIETLNSKENPLSLSVSGQANPLLVYRREEVYFITDGNHRLQALKLAGATHARCRIYSCREAALDAVLLGDAAKTRSIWDQVRVGLFRGRSQQDLAEILGLTPGRISQVAGVIDAQTGEFDPEFRRLFDAGCNGTVAQEMATKLTPEQSNRLLSDGSAWAERKNFKRKKTPTKKMIDLLDSEFGQAYFEDDLPFEILYAAARKEKVCSEHALAILDDLRKAGEEDSWGTPEDLKTIIDQILTPRVVVEDDVVELQPAIPSDGIAVTSFGERQIVLTFPDQATRDQALADLDPSLLFSRTKPSRN